ncbi:MAG: hypothetical protein VSS52_011165 [Thiotrichaceae bacterium]|nr:hypothetical protein [Thiotrichaceae bacterium]
MSASIPTAALRSATPRHGVPSQVFVEQASNVMKQIICGYNDASNANNDGFQESTIPYYIALAMGNAYRKSQINARNEQHSVKYNKDVKTTGRYPDSGDVDANNLAQTPNNDNADYIDNLNELLDYGDDAQNDFNDAYADYRNSDECQADNQALDNFLLDKVNERYDFKDAHKKLLDGLIVLDVIETDKVKEARERGERILAKAQAPTRGYPIIFLVNEKGNISSIRTISKTRNHFEGKELPQAAQIILCQLVCNLAVKRGYAPPLVRESVKEFSKNLTEQSQGFVDKYIEKRMKDPMKAYFNELLLDTKAPQYELITADRLVDGLYLDWRLLDAPFKLILIQAPLGIGKSVAGGIYHLMRHLQSHVLSLAARVNLTIALTNSMNKAAVDYSNGKITQKEHVDKFNMMVSQYDVEDVKGLKYDLVNDTGLPLKFVFTIDSILKMSERKGGLGLFDEDFKEIAKRRKVNTLTGKRIPFILYLDEIELLTQHLTGRTIGDKTLVLNALKTMISLADKVIVMDAFLTQKSVDFIADIAKCDYKVYQVESNHMRNINVTFSAGNKTHSAGLEKLMADCQTLSETAKGDRVKGRIAIACNTKNDAKAIGLKLDGLFCNNSELDSGNTLNIAVYTGGSSKELIVYRRKSKNNATETFDVNEFQDNPNKFLAEKNIDVFIYSPVMESGVSIDKTPSFTKAYGFATPSLLSSSANGLKQAMYRFRHAFDWHISIAAYTSGGDRFISMKTLEDFVDYRKAEIQKAAISIRDNGKTLATVDAGLQSIVNELDTVAAKDTITSIASGNHKFSQEFYDIKRFEAIAYLATTQFARYFYYDLLAMGILPENIHGVITHDAVSFRDEKIAVAYDERYKVAIAKTPTQTQLDDLHNIKGDLTPIQQAEKRKGDLIKLYSRDGTLDHGDTDVFDLFASERRGVYGEITDYINFNSLSIDSQVKLIAAWERKRTMLIDTSNTTNPDSRHIAKMLACVGTVGLGGDESYKTDNAKVGDTLLKASKVTICNLLFEQYQQDDGVSTAFLELRGVAKTLEFKGRNINEQAQQYLRKYMGIPLELFEGKKIKRGGKSIRITRFKQEFEDGGDWFDHWFDENPIAIHAMGIAKQGKDSNDIYTQKIASFLAKR